MLGYKLFVQKGGKLICDGYTFKVGKTISSTAGVQVFYFYKEINRIMAFSLPNHDSIYALVEAPDDVTTDEQGTIYSSSLKVISLLDGKFQSGEGTYYFHKGLAHRTDGPAVEDSDCTCWYIYGKLHRTDGPAIIWENGDENWFYKDKFHRTTGPAVIRKGRRMEWYIHGKLHRTSGPAIMYKSGDEQWYRHGKLHRTDGPAVISNSGDRKWYYKGKLHRRGGPAMEGTGDMYIHGKKIYKKFKSKGKEKKCMFIGRFCRCGTGEG